MPTIPVVAALADRPAVRRHAPVIRYFSMISGSPVIDRHRKAGGISCELRDGQLVETERGQERVMADVAELPGAFGGLAPHVVANALAAVAACRALGISAKDIRRALATFVPAADNPGRGSIYLAVRPPGHPGLRAQRRRPGRDRRHDQQCLGRRAGSRGHPARRPPR